MSRVDAYGSDLAYIHDVGFGHFIRSAGPGVLELLRQNGITSGDVVDLGCGGGIWAKQLVDAGYHAIGVDISRDMIDIARRRAPDAEFHVASFLEFPIPCCRAVTALSEVFNYLFDAGNSLGSLRKLCGHIFDALAPGGLLVFDVAEPGLRKNQKQSFRLGHDWACLVEFRHDEAKSQLVRDIVSFRKIGATYRRHQESHRLQLYAGSELARMLRRIGFRVRLARHYGAFALPKKVVAVVARRPG